MLPEVEVTLAVEVVPGIVFVLGVTLVLELVAEV